MTADSLLEPLALPPASNGILDDEEISNELTSPPSLLMKALISPTNAATGQAGIKVPPLTAAAKMRNHQHVNRRLQYNSLGVRAPVSKESQKKIQNMKA